MGTKKKGLRHGTFSSSWISPERKRGDRGREWRGRTVQDELVAALTDEMFVEDAATLKGQTLQEHDKAHHPGGYHEGDTCKFRDKLKTETETDKADELDTGGDSGFADKEIASKKKDSGQGGCLKEALVAVAKKVKRFIPGVKVRVSDKPYGGESERKNRTSVSRDALENAINRIFDEGIVDIRVKEGQREKIVKGALEFFDKYGETEFPISTGGVMFFAPAPETIKRHGGDAELAWAEYAIHSATNDNVDKNGKHYRTYGKEKIEKVNPRIIEIVAADNTTIQRGRALYFLDLDENHSARLVARPEHGDLRVDDLTEVTATYMKRNKTPGTTMPLARAVEEWTSRGDIPNASTDVDSIANLGSGVHGGDERKSISHIFTGSSADYDKPSLLKVGSGEGNQVYGWGLYGSNQREVAEGYAAMDVGKKSGIGYIKNGKPIEQFGKSVENKVAGALALWGDVETAIEEMKGVHDSEDIIKELKEHGHEYREYHPQEIIYEQTFFTDRKEGDESHLLSWYEPVSEENKKRIAKGLAQRWMEKLRDMGRYTPKKEELCINAEYERLGGLDKKISGGKIYSLLSERLGSPKAASELLAASNIDGIKYPVDSYGSKEVKNGDEEGWNYVSFRDDNIRIDHKWVDGGLRYFRDDGGKVVGTYNRKTNKVVLYPGANADTIAHELCGHATWQYAEQQATKGDKTLLNKMNEVVYAEIAKPIWKEVAANYGRDNHEIQREEVWAHIVGHKGSRAIEEIRKTEKGQKWYQRAWGVVKDAWKGLLSKAGLNRIKTDGIEKMSPEEFSDYMVEQMMSGRTLGKIRKMKERKKKRYRSLMAELYPTIDSEEFIEKLASLGTMEEMEKELKRMLGKA